MGDRLSKVDNKYSAVIAIDFGTSYSGYAYSYRKGKENVLLNDNWGAEASAAYYKTPTSVMYRDSDDRFDSFGFEAEEKYFQSLETASGGDIPALFRTFKMQLYGQEHLGRQMMLTSHNRDEKAAMDVFADALRYIKDHAIRKLERHQNSGVGDNKYPLRWIVTVPAIWGDKQKIFMREACVKAGLIGELGSKNLIIALEPECASLYCRKLPWDKFMGVTRERQPKLAEGTSYMVVDMGGGTVDITVHKVVKGGIEEVIPSTGGPWGGSNVNKEFSDLLEKSLGKQFVEHLNAKKPSIWHRMMIDFEKAKRSFKGDNSVHIPLQYGLGEAFLQYSKDKDPRGSIREILTDDKGIFISDAGNLVIHSETLHNFFGKVVDNIYDTVIEAIDKCPNSDKPKFIFLVGGFSDCPHVQTKMKTLEEVCRPPKPVVLIPHEASLCVLRGAVVFGHDPNAIKARMSKYTYAFLTERDFKEGKDNPMRIKAGSNMKVECLEPIVKKGTKLQEGFYKEKEITVGKTKQAIPITVYISESSNVDDPNDGQVKELGSVAIRGRTLKGQKDRKIKIFFIFGKSELEVRALDTSTNEEVSNSFGFDSKDSENNCPVM